MLTIKELIEECKRHGIDITPLIPKPTTFQFSATALYNRGLGPEYITLQPAQAKNIAEAEQMAEAAALDYFKTNKGFEKAVLKEIRIKPI
jgi:hypothetical protein